jgi:hypothetical protein
MLHPERGSNKEESSHGNVTNECTSMRPRTGFDDWWRGLRKRRVGEGLVIVKDYVAVVKAGEEIKDDRATNHE